MTDFGNLTVYGTDVRDHGAIGDGLTDDGPAIQAALDGGGRVVIPFGTYRIGATLRIPSRTHLIAHPRARLYLADGAGVDRSVHLLASAHPDEGDELIRVEGGIWDGNNPNNPRGPDEPNSYTGVLMNWTNVRGLVLRQMTLRDPEAYYVRLGQVSGFLVESIRLEAPHLRPNQDGIHLGGYCEDGVIRDIAGIGASVPNDDLVALNADDANHRAQNLGKLCGPIRRIRVENLSATDCHTFVRLLSVESPIEDIEVRHLRGGCNASALNLDACRECRVPLFDPDDPAVAGGVGHIARIQISDLIVHKTSARSHKPLVDLRTRVQGFVIDGFRRDAKQDVQPHAASLTVAAVGAATVRLEGLTAAQIEALQQAATVEPSTLQRLAPLAAGHDSLDLARYAGTWVLGAEDGLQVVAGGWDHLAVNGGMDSDAHLVGGAATVWRA